MSLFPQSLTAEMGSEIKLNSHEERILNFINDFRFKPNQIYDRIIKILKNNTIKQSKIIRFSELNKSIKYNSEEDLLKATSYFFNMKNMNQVLSDLYHNEEYNSEFVKLFSFKENQSDFNELQAQFKTSLKLSAICYYHLNQVEILFCSQFIPYLILQEYFRLITNQNSGQQILNDHIALISNNYNMCFIKVCQMNQLLNVVIGLGYNNNILSISEIVKSSTQMNRFKTTKIQFTQHQNQINENTIKYHYIPRQIIQKMFVILDKNKKNRINSQDIQRQFLNHYISFSIQFCQDMIKQAKIDNQNHKSEITLHELYCTMQTKKKKINGQWKFVQKPLRKYWIWLLKILIYKQNIEQNLKQNVNKFHKSENGKFFVKQIQNKANFKKYHPEAGLIIHNTLNIQEVQTKIVKTRDTSTQLELLMNNNFKSSEKYNTIGFQTLKFYNTLSNSNFYKSK